MKRSMTRASACASIRGISNVSFHPFGQNLYHLSHRIQKYRLTPVLLYRYKFHVYYCIVDFGVGLSNFLESPAATTLYAKSIAHIHNANNRNIWKWWFILRAKHWRKLIINGYCVNEEKSIWKTACTWVI